MKVTIQKQVGKTNLTFEIEMDKGRDALFNASFLASTPNVCGLCESDDVTFSGNKGGGYTFVKVRCEKCNATADMGEYKDGGYFWKQWEIYEKGKDGGRSSGNSEKPKEESSKEIDPKDIPF